MATDLETAGASETAHTTELTLRKLYNLLNGIVPGGLAKESDGNLAAILAGVAGPNAEATSVLYDGGNTANALRVNKTTSAVPAGAATITVGTNNVLDLMLTNATAAETVILSVAEYSAATPTLATLIRQREITMPADQGRTVDRACVGLVTGVEHYAKDISVAITPGSYVNICAKSNSTGPLYLRYALRKSLMV
jgi:hypothetical protein